ncbi:uncharacterized protein LOC107361509 [Tetranychus urticae]|uniref:uncharacterized protein LOC107361509 n=1 Tax=Tetranychus urticae TaxID=32264 RepID=UPI000D65938B|nr:uncharacterized protein LOC107361509 [Tetranychus urticae]
MRILFSFGSPKEVPKDDQVKNKTESPSLPSVDLLDSASVLIPAFFILLLCSCFGGATGEVIEFSNNGPVTIDTPITLTIKNNYKTVNPSFQYRIEFPNFDEYNKTINSNNTEVAYKVIFSSPKAKQGYYTIFVDAWYCISGVSAYSIGWTLSKPLLGFINVTQNIGDISLANEFVSTASPVNLTAELYDPRGFFDSANITYKWIVNGSPQEDIYNRFIIRNFTQPQLNNISVAVSINRTNFQKSDIFFLSLQSKDPINNLTVNGSTNVIRDESLELNIKINGGTPPFYYCWEITNSTISGGNTKPSIESIFWRRYTGMKSSHSNCEDTDESSFNINSHFEEAGNKTLNIVVSNWASYLTKIMTISVHERESLRQPAANKPAVIQESSNIMKKYKPVIYSEEPEISDKEIESYLRSKNEIEFINYMQTDFQNSSWKD